MENGRHCVDNTFDVRLRDSGADEHRVHGGGFSLLYIIVSVGDSEFPIKLIEIFH